MGISLLTAIIAGLVIVTTGTIFVFIPNTIYFAPVDKESVQFEICPPYCGGTVSADEVYLTEIFGEELSIVPTNVVFTPSDQNAFEQYLDEEKPLGQTATPTFTLETSASLIDPSGNLVSKSSFLNIPLQPASLIDEQGNVLVGSAQVAFFGKTTENVEVNAEGTAEFWLDDKLIATKKIFFKSDGIQRKTTPLFLDNSITTAIITKPPTAFTFKFTDEPFEDLTTHTYRVIIKDFVVETISQDVRKKYNWSGENLAYQLVMNADKSQITITDEKGQNISVFKDDNKLIVCDLDLHQQDYNEGGGQNEATHDFPYTKVHYTKNKPPVIDIIRKDDNKLIATIDIMKARSTSNIIYEILESDKNKMCAIFPELQRSTDYIFRMEGKDYEYHTPRIQQNILLSCTPLATYKSLNPYNPSSVYLGDRCESTFAKSWDFIYSVQTNQKIKINSSILKICGQDTSVLASRTVFHEFNRNPYVLSSQSPTWSAPKIQIYDDSTKIGEGGGKPYCTYNELPNGKVFKLHISELVDRGTITEIERNTNGNFIRYIDKKNPSIPAGISTINTPTDSSKEFYVTGYAQHNGWGNVSPSELFDKFWSFFVTSNFGYPQ